MKDNEIIQLIKEDENAGFSLMYQKFFDVSCALMHRKGVTSNEEKKDVFQLSLIGFMIITRKEDFQLSCKLSTFFFGIVIRQCYKVFSRQSKYTDDFFDDDKEKMIYSIPDTYSFVEDLNNSEVNEIIQKEMGDNSKMQILKMMYLEGKNQQEIADELGYANTDSIKTQKYKGVKMIRKKLTEKYKEEDLKYYID